MKKFFKDNIHHVIAFVLVLVFALFSVFSVYKISYAKDFKYNQKKTYESCVTFLNGGDFYEMKREDMLGDAITWTENYCSNVIEGYKEGYTQNVNDLFIEVYIESGITSYIVTILSLLATILSLRELKKLSKMRKRIKLADVYKEGLKSLWLGPIYVILTYVILFVLRGPFNPSYTSETGIVPLILIIIFSVITILFFINIAIFIDRLFKNKKIVLIVNIITLILLYSIVDMWALGLIGLGVYGDLDALTEYSLINYTVQLSRNDTTFDYTGIWIMLGRCVLTFVFAYLAYNDKLNKKFMKK